MRTMVIELTKAGAKVPAFLRVDYTRKQVGKDSWKTRTKYTTEVGKITLQIGDNVLDIDPILMGLGFQLNMGAMKTRINEWHRENAYKYNPNKTP